MGQKEEKYAIAYTSFVPSDLAKLDSFWQEEVRAVIEGRVCKDPQLHGKPLRYSLKGHRSARVGDYRIVYRIDKRTVRIVGIVHRSREYRDIEKRLG